MPVCFLIMACSDTKPSCLFLSLIVALIPDTQAIGDDLLFDMDTPAQANTPQIHRRRLIIDKVTELPHDKIRDQINDTSDIVTEATFLPTSPEMLRFKTIEKQGIKFFINLNAPVHLAPELQALFSRSRKRSPSVTSIGDDDQDEHQRKQPRLFEQAPVTATPAATTAAADDDEYDVGADSEEVVITMGLFYLQLIAHHLL